VRLDAALVHQPADHRFKSGGSWSWFGCPTCGKWVRTLRLHFDDIVCKGCCERRGLHWRVWTMSARQRAERRIPKLLAMLESDESLRLKPHLWGTLERRGRLTAALREAEFRVAQLRVPRRKVAAVIDPCDEPDFKPPKTRRKPGIVS
jgi:hypothetical protein